MQNILSRIYDLFRYIPEEPMLFNTGLFLALFVALMLVVECVKNIRWIKMAVITAFSLYFYYKSGGWCVLILLGVCVSDFCFGLLLNYCRGRQFLSKSIITAAVLIDLGMLVYFKYANLLLEAFASITSTNFDPLNVILPAGISFFLFRSISYLVDIYRGDLEACRNFFDYLFFLTFFPPLLAGPVVRAKDLLPQIRQNNPATRGMVSEGMLLVLMGLIKKVVIADYISGNFVDRIFDNPLLYSGFENLVGCIGFSVQLYCDFSGYSDMAIGLALMLGYRFKDNFKAPFKAQNPSDFWRRWHISLSTWLRDYLYIPLGGNRCSKVRMYSNNMLTMLLGGLWHGASWMYLLWGAYHGALLILHKMLRNIHILPGKFVGHWLVKIANMSVMFVLIVAGFAIFRAPDLTTLASIGTSIFSNFHGSVALQFVEGYPFIILALVVALIAHYSPRGWTEQLTKAYVSSPIVLQAVVVTAVLFLVIQTRQSDLVPFLYLKY